MGIKDPSGKIDILNTQFDMGIYPNEECGLYDAQYLTNDPGTYEVDIRAKAYGIDTNFSTTFDAAEFYEFDIIRTAQSKIDPTTNPNSFDVKINIESFVDADSIEITETIPTVFDVQTDAQVKTVGDNKILTWSKKLVENKTFVEYTYSIPYEFPKLYQLGPTQIDYNKSKFVEARPWFVAADPVSTGTEVVPTTNTGSATATIAIPSISSGTDLLVIAAFGLKDADSSKTVTDVDWDVNGTPQQMLELAGSPISTNMGSGLWYLAAPNTGATDMTVTLGGSSTNWGVKVIVYSGVHQTTPFTDIEAISGKDGTATTFAAVTTTSGVDTVFGSVVTEAVAPTTTGQTSAIGSAVTVLAGNTFLHAGEIDSDASTETLNWNKNDGKKWSGYVFNIEAAPVAVTQTLSETLAITDVVSTANSFTRSLSETLAITDVVVTAAKVVAVPSLPLIASISVKGVV